MRYFVWCDYDGTDFAGWQRQPNASTVQQTIEESLSLFLGSTIEITGCGRTDAGVHARDYCFHFDVAADIEAELFIYKANSILPSSVAIHHIRPVSSEAHARFDASARSYQYRIVQTKEPLYRQCTAYIQTVREYNLDLLNQAARHISSLQKFGSFCKTHGSSKTTKCTLTQCEWQINMGQLVLYISADRFLRGMVRLIVGTCINYMQGKISMDSLISLTQDEKTLPFAWSVPPNGLMFTGVRYDGLDQQITEK